MKIYKSKKICYIFAVASIITIWSLYSLNDSKLVGNFRNVSNSIKNAIIQNDSEVWFSKNENSKNQKYVYPLGKIIGIKADTDGVLVLGYEDEDTEYVGGIKVGDNIVEINKKRIKDSKDVVDLLKGLDKSSKSVEVKYERNKKFETDEVKLKKTKDGFRLGLWVRDKISGVGTMTFYDPNSDSIGAIGHAIKDFDTDELLKIRDGRIYIPEKINIIKSTDKDIGYIKGDYQNSDAVGKFTNNSDIGINGKFLEKKENKSVLDANEMQLMEVANINEVKKGKACILFEDKNKNITTFEIKIEDIVTCRGNNKEIVLEVVDKNLIDYTGGIIQGMSGAPIIQNDKLIGAVTHVSKDNPIKGYGILINEMIK